MEDKSFLYAIPWIILTFLFVFIGWRESINEDKRVKYGIWGFFIFLVFFGLRGFVGWDYEVYYLIYTLDTYDLFDPLTLSEKIDFIGFDWGFSFFLILIKSLTSNYHVFIFISTLIDAVLIYIFFKRYSVNFGYSFAVFVLISSTVEIDLLRNVKGLLLVCLSLKYIYERKLIKFSLLILLASLFHYSSIIALPFYFFLHKEPKQGLIWTLFVVGNIFYFLDFYVLNSFYKGFAALLGGIYQEKSLVYLDADNNNKWGLSFGFFERTLSWILLIIYNKRMIKEKPEVTIFVNATIIYLMSYFMFSGLQVFLTRISLIFSFSYWIVYPIFIKFILNSKFKIYSKAMIAYLILYCFVRAGIKNTIMDKYENVLFSSSTYDDKIYETSSYRNNNEDGFKE